MHARNMVRKGFTLVEILIVVVILGILAAIVIPQFSSASDSAKASSALSQLQTIRSQIELYKNQHNGVAPALATNWNQFLQYSNVDGGNLGTAPDSSATPPRIYGPYMQKAPVNPFTGGSAVADGNTADWDFDGTEFKIVMDATKAANFDIDPSDFTAAP